MARTFDDLHPYPLERHLHRLKAEWETHRTLYGLKEKDLWRPDPAHDLSMTLHGRRVQNPLGPAAGPQTQMVQNIAISWLMGCRVMELKTLQILDRLEIPRPCIDTRTYGWNVEWSQELLIEQSLEEYVTAWMLIRILIEEDVLGLEDPDLKAASMPLFDMSVGYDLKGIQTEKVQGFMKGMRDASAVIDRLRSRLTGYWAKYRDLDFEPVISESVTLSTFHGCPKEEIEAIGEFLLDEGYHSIIKLNPTQLGSERVDEILHGKLGFTDCQVNPNAYVVGMSLEEAFTLVRHLEEHRAEIGAETLGIKLTNTLEVVNSWDYFTEDILYMSGRPLHVLATTLGGEFRKEFGGDLLISFSAGIDPDSFHQTMSLGYSPITTCTDLLVGNGYRRLPSYFKKAYKAMDEVGATTREEYIRNRAGVEDLAEAHVVNNLRYQEELLEDPRYHRDAHMKSPKKIGSMLELWDCINCDKCVKICPNDANFSIEVEPFEGTSRSWVFEGGAFRQGDEEPLRIEKKKQYANFTDFCNECALCDQYCPEDGGPYIVKPRFFGSRKSYEDKKHMEGILLTREDERDVIYLRLKERELRFEFGETAVCTLDGGLRFALDAEGNPAEVLEPGEGAGEYATKYWVYSSRVRESIRSPEQRDNYIWPLLEI